MKALLSFIFFFSCSAPVGSNIVSGTVVKTATGLVVVDRLAVGERVTSFSERSIVDYLPITHLSEETINEILFIKTTNGAFHSSLTQSFYDPVLKDWVVASNLKDHNTLVDYAFNHLRIVRIEKLTLLAKSYQLLVDYPSYFYISTAQILTRSHGFNDKFHSNPGLTPHRIIDDFSPSSPDLNKILAFVLAVFKKSREYNINRAEARCFMFNQQATHSGDLV